MRDAMTRHHRRGHADLVQHRLLESVRIEAGAARRQVQQVHPHVEQRRSDQLDAVEGLREVARALELADQCRRQRAALRIDQPCQHLRRGQLEDAIAALRRAAELGPGTSRPRAVLAQHLALQGRAAEARGILAALQRQAATAYVAPTSLAMVLAALGEDQAALDALDEAHRARDARLIFPKDDPSWQRLRLDGLPPGLTPV